MAPNNTTTLTSLSPSIYPLPTPTSPTSANAFPNLMMTSEKVNRELFVGNVPSGTPGELLVQFLNIAMQRTNLCRGNQRPIVSCRMNMKFAFVECATVEDANMAQNLNCIPFLGTFLRVSRPSNYAGPHVPSMTFQELTGQPLLPNISPVAESALAEERVNRELFVGNITPEMTEELLTEFLGRAMEKVGLTCRAGNPVVSCRVIGKFAFVGLRSSKEATNALNLNNIPFKGVKLRLGRPSKYTGPVTHHGNWEDILARYYAELNVPSTPSLSNSVKPSRIVELKNMVNGDVLESDETYEDVMEDVKEECSKYGVLRNVVIPRSEDGMGKIFLEYVSMEDSARAVNGLTGRTFDGHTIDVVYFDEEKYMRGDFSGCQANGNKKRCEVQQSCFMSNAA